MTTPRLIQGKMHGKKESEMCVAEEGRDVTNEEYGDRAHLRRMSDTKERTLIRRANRGLIVYLTVTADRLLTTITSEALM